jgi:hypothetical protein
VPQVSLVQLELLELQVPWAAQEPLVYLVTLVLLDPRVHKEILELPAGQVKQAPLGQQDLKETLEQLVDPDWMAILVPLDL